MEGKDPNRVRMQYGRKHQGVVTFCNACVKCNRNEVVAIRIILRPREGTVIQILRPREGTVLREGI
eukprot:scaffold198703_cov20-Attheya_sp.AAC.1